MTDKDKISSTTTNPLDYLKAIIGAVIFLTAGILLTSKSLNPESTTTLILQFFTLGLVLIAISFKGTILTSRAMKMNFLESFFCLVLP